MFCRKRECKWMGCLLWLVTFFLGILFLVQLPVVALLLLDREWTLPAPWVEAAVDHALGEEYSIQFDAVRLNRSGRLAFDGAVVKNALGRDILRAESAEVDIYLPSTVFGMVYVEQIKARGIQIFSSEGPLGPAESLCSVEALNLIREEDSWRIDDTRLWCGSLAASVSGTLSEAFIRQIESGETEKDPLAGMQEQVQRLQSQLQRLKNPFVRVTIASSGSEANVQLNLSADRIDLPFEVRMEDEIRLSFSIRLDGDQVYPGPIQLVADRIIYGDTIQAENPFLQTDPPTGMMTSGIFAGADLLFSASQISYEDIVLQSPTVETVLGSGLRVNLRGQVGLFGHPILLKGKASPLRGTGELEVKGLISVSEAKQLIDLPQKAREAVVEFPRGVYLDAVAEFGEAELVPQQVRYFAQTESFDIQGFTGRVSSARGTIFPEERVLEVDKLMVEQSDHNLAGSYEHNFITNEFRFQIHGGFMPQSISGWMRDWWDELWANFIINETPYVDLDMIGDWDHHADRQIFGGIRFRNLVYKGMNIERGYARLRTRPFFFELFDLHAYRPEGKATGSLGILADWDAREPSLNLYDFQSGFRFEKVLPLFGDSLAETLSVLALSGPPQLDIAGKIYYPERKKPDPRNLLRIEAATQQPLTYRDIQMDRLELSALYSERTLRLDPIRFGLGKGRGEGWIVQRPEDSPQGETSLQLTLADAVPADVVEAIPALADKVGERIQTEEDPDREKNRLDFSIECSGDLDNPETLVGVGSLDLHSPNLANLRLLGILSRISEELPLPVTLGSFQFERASTSFLLNRGLVEFPDMTLFSPSSHVLAEGEYQMSEQTIDFNARMQLLGQVKFPILSQIGSLLFSPVGKVFEFRIWGPMEDLKWRLYLDPRSW